MLLSSRPEQTQSSSAVFLTQVHEVTVSQSKLPFGLFYKEIILSQTMFSKLPVLNLTYIRGEENHRLYQHFSLQYPLIDYSSLKLPIFVELWLKRYHLAKGISLWWSDCSALQKQSRDMPPTLSSHYLQRFFKAIPREISVPEQRGQVYTYLSLTEAICRELDESRRR